MGQKKLNFKALKALPIGTDFSEAVEVDKGSFHVDDFTVSTPDGEKFERLELFGRFNPAAFMYVNEAKMVQETVLSGRITEEMADHLLALPIEYAFKVEQLLRYQILGDLKGKSSNYFVTVEQFNKDLKSAGLPEFKPEDKTKDKDVPKADKADGPS